MNVNDESSLQQTRRGFLATVAGAAALPLAGGESLVQVAQAQAQVPPAAPAAITSNKKLNILFVFTDQERYFAKWPKGLSLPGRERLEKSGVSFTNHYCPATMCTSSRSILLTGLQTADNGMFENTDVPWIKSLSDKIPTVGHMLRRAGYYTAYKGKWHLSKEFDTTSVEKFMTKEMERYGFADNFSPGDLIGHQHGGYAFDHLTAGSAINWLRTKGRPLSDDGKPWCMFVSLVNPHDIMYFNTDAPGEAVQDTGKLRMQAVRAPDHAIYRQTWDLPIASTLHEPLNHPKRPAAHAEFDKMWGHVLGRVPLEVERWRRFTDYYINCIRDVDRQIASLLQELDALGLSDRTIIIFTADHGEAAGAHGLRGKGPFAYEEALHLPMHIVHPDVKGGQSCRALTSHIDMVPTVMAMSGASAEQSAEFAGRALPGKDLTRLLGNPGQHDLHAARPSILFTYSGLATNDSDVFRFAAEAVAAGKNPMEEAKRQGFRPNLKKRGSVRSTFDGRYKFSRYFAPVDRNKPTTIDELYKWNDVELFDLATDPAEKDNLAKDPVKNRDLVMTMSGKLEDIIKAEIGVDDGREMPDIPQITWGLDKIDL